jgi:hypothetical protein
LIPLKQLFFMKKTLLLFSLLCCLLAGGAMASTDIDSPFITHWDLSKSTGSGTTQITFGVATTGTVNYTWSAADNELNSVTYGNGLFVAVTHNGSIQVMTSGAATPTITNTGTPTAFTACAGTAATQQSFTVSGSNLTNNITITAPTGFEVSTTSGSGFGNSATLTPSSGSVATTTIDVRMAATATGTPSGDVTVASTGATDKTVAVSGTVNVCVNCPSGNTLHVNASVSGGTGDGESWANAYASLSDALAKAHACSNVTLIKVASGTYKPSKKPFNAGVEMTTTTGSRDITFHIPDGVTIEGGYNASTGTRDITANVTTLSGDIDNNNTLDDGNAYHVVLTTTASSNTTSTIKIDGFAITGGNANGTYYIIVNGNTVARNIGGGICTLSGTNTLTNNMI